MIGGVERGFLCIEGAEILAAGREEDVELWLRPGDLVWDAEGLWILPAWTDSHLHVFHLARQRRFAQLQGCASVGELERRLAADAGGEWVLGRGWDEVELGAMPDRALLDRLVPQRPALVWRRCGHIASANSRALALAGVTRSTETFGGKVDLDDHGEPTGVLRETAIDLVAGIVPDASPEVFRRDVVTTLHDLARLGIAAVYTNDDVLNTGDPLAFYQDVRRGAGDRVLPRVRWDPYVDELDRQIATARVSGYGDRGVALGSVKFVTDGSLGGRTAFMLDAYPGQDGRGIFRFDERDLRESLARAAAHGLRVCLHAIGDAAARSVLESLEAVAERGPLVRPRIIHSQFVHPADRPRYRALGAVADVQPLFAVSDLPLRDRVGGAWAHGYAWRSLLRDGAAMSFSSDAPVEAANPILGLRAALYRGGRRPDEAGWDQERLDLHLSLQTYSAGGAYAGMEEHWRGRLQPGMAADVVVVDPQLFCAEDPGPDFYRDGPELRPSQVLIEGRPVDPEGWSLAR